MRILDTELTYEDQRIVAPSTSRILNSMFSADRLDALLMRSYASGRPCSAVPGRKWAQHYVEAMRIAEEIANEEAAA